MKTINDRLKEHKEKGGIVNDYEILKAFEQAKQQEYKRMYRIYERVRNIMNYENAFFITLTYSEENYHLRDTENMRKWCKKLCHRFIGNNDYGKTNERFHHHVFGNLITNDYKLLQNSWKYGNIDLQPLRDSNDKAIGKYIDRIAKHSLKNSADKIIRSKQK